MPIQLTPELAAKMLDVWQRRQKDPRGTVYACTILEAAVSGKPDFALELPNFIRVRKAAQDSPPVRHPDTSWLKKLP